MSSDIEERKPCVFVCGHEVCQACAKSLPVTGREGVQCTFCDRVSRVPLAPSTALMPLRERFAGTLPPPPSYGAICGGRHHTEPVPAVCYCAICVPTDQCLECCTTLHAILNHTTVPIAEKKFPEMTCAADGFHCNIVCVEPECSATPTIVCFQCLSEHGSNPKHRGHKGQHVTVVEDRMRAHLRQQTSGLQLMMTELDSAAQAVKATLDQLGVGVGTITGETSIATAINAVNDLIDRQKQALDAKRRELHEQIARIGESAQAAGEARLREYAEALAKARFAEDVSARAAALPGIPFVLIAEEAIRLVEAASAQGVSFEAPVSSAIDVSFAPFGAGIPLELGDLATVLGAVTVHAGVASGSLAPARALQQKVIPAKDDGGDGESSSKDSSKGKDKDKDTNKDKGKEKEKHKDKKKK
eukprot:c39058_g1_i1.p1 GENE.c39058_g1_i1~~c39058_g1_i1.p1  ORF type:complete len:451 (-),score=61.06 c39058_g1_i1:20-1267(-)